MAEDTSEESIIDKVADQFLVEESQSGLVYDPERSDLVEKAYKAEILASEGDDYPDFDGWPIETLTLGRVYNEVIKNKEDIEQVLSEIREEEDTNDQFTLEKDLLFRVENIDNIIIFFIMSSEVIQALAGEVIEKKILKSPDIDGVRDFTSNIDKETQEELLYYSETIDKGTRDMMINVRKTRNKIVHDFHDQLYLDSFSDLDNIISVMKRTLATIDDLHEIAHDFRPFESEDW